MRFVFTLTVAAAVLGQFAFATAQTSSASELVSNRAVSLTSDVVTWFTNICESPTANGIRITSCNLVKLLESILLPNTDDVTYFSILNTNIPIVFAQITEIIGTYSFVFQNIANIVNLAVASVQGAVTNLVLNLSDLSNLDAIAVDVANSLSVLVAIVTSIIDAALSSNLSNVSAQAASTCASSLAIVFTFVNLIFVAINASGIDTNSSVNYPIISNAISIAFAEYSAVITDKSDVVIANENSTLTDSLPNAFINFNIGSGTLLTALVPVTNVYTIPSNSVYTIEELLIDLNGNVGVYSGFDILNKIQNLFPININATASSSTLTDLNADFSNFSLGPALGEIIDAFAVSNSLTQTSDSLNSLLQAHNSNVDDLSNQLTAISKVLNTVSVDMDEFVSVINFFSSQIVSVLIGTNGSIMINIAASGLAVAVALDTLILAVTSIVEINLNSFSDLNELFDIQSLILSLTTIVISIENLFVVVSESVQSDTIDSINSALSILTSSLIKVSYAIANSVAILAANTTNASIDSLSLAYVSSTLTANAIAFSSLSNVTAPTFGTIASFSNVTQFLNSFS